MEKSTGNPGLDPTGWTQQLPKSRNSLNQPSSRHRNLARWGGSTGSDAHGQEKLLWNIILNRQTSIFITLRIIIKHDYLVIIRFIWHILASLGTMEHGYLLSLATMEHGPIMVIRHYQQFLTAQWRYRLCLTPMLLPTLMDGLVWRSRQTQNGLRRVNYYVTLGKCLVGGWWLVGG